MGKEESKLAMVQRHVREGAEHIAHQRELVVRLQADGHLTKEAEALLRDFEGIQRQHEEHLARIVREQTGEGADTTTS